MLSEIGVSSTVDDLEDMQVAAYNIIALELGKLKEAEHKRKK